MDFWLDDLLREIILIIKWPIVRKHHERVGGRAQRIYAQLDRLIQFKLIEQIAIRVKYQLLSENVRVLVILEVAIERKTMMRWVHPSIVRSASRLRAAEKHTGVPEGTWRVYL